MVLFLAWFVFGMSLVLVMLFITIMIIDHNQNKLRKQLEHDFNEIWKAPIE